MGSDIYIIRTTLLRKREKGFERIMKNKSILAIGLIFILLPLVTAMSPVSATTSGTPDFSNISIEDWVTSPSVEAGDKFIYDITSFHYGQGFMDLINQMFIDDPDVPDFNFGTSGTLEGSQIWSYVTYMEDSYLYQYDWDTEDHVNETEQTLMQVMSALKLNSDMSAYVNLSQFSYPEDAIPQDQGYYYDSWPRTNFDFDITDTDSEFWDGFHDQFPSSFSWGYTDAYDGSGWPWLSWPEAHWYDSDEGYYFGQDVGYYFGYHVGRNAFYQSDYSASDPDWDKPTTAANAWMDGFLEGRPDGFDDGKDDYVNNDRIPVRHNPDPYDQSTLTNLAKGEGYKNGYHTYYSSGFFYEGAQEYYNTDLYWKLFDGPKGNSYVRGYMEGFSEHYENGWYDGRNDNTSSTYHGDYYSPPNKHDPWDSYDAGYQDGKVDGYEFGYEHGYADDIGDDWQPDNWEYIHGMQNAVWNGYQDGFPEGANDYVQDNPKDNTTSDPHPDPANEYEEGYNHMYPMSYSYGYDNGWLYAYLVDPDGNELNWLTHEGPFYHIILPDFVWTLQEGSVIPFPIDVTMFTELNFSLMDYDFDWETHDYEPLTEHFSPISWYAPMTDWAAYDGLNIEWEPGMDDPGIVANWDQGNDNFTMELYFNDESSDVEIIINIEYDTDTGYLRALSFAIDFYSMTNMDASIGIEFNTIEHYDLHDPVVPDSWSYLVDDFAFEYDVPPEVPSDVISDLDEFKSGGTDAVGKTFMDVTWNGHDQLWTNYTFEMYDPNNPSDTSGPESIYYPTVAPMIQVLPDWSLYEGLMTTGSSIMGNLAWVGEAAVGLFEANPNMDMFDFDLNGTMDSHHEASTDTMYMYMGMSMGMGMEMNFMNEDFEWEQVIAGIYFNCSLWVAYDYTTGIFLGAGLSVDVDATLTLPDDTFAPASNFAAHLTMKIRADDTVITSGNLAPVTDYVTLPSVNTPDPDNTPPTITNVGHTPNVPVEGDNVVVSANVTDDTAVQEVMVHYRVNSSDWQKETMALTSGDTYSANIGSFGVGDEVEYYITARDATIYVNIAEEDNAGSYYSFTVEDGESTATTPTDGDEEPTTNIGFGFADLAIISVGLLSIVSIVVIKKRR